MESSSLAQRARVLYDDTLASGEAVRQLVFPRVFGDGQWIGQYSDNSADDIRLLAKRARIVSDSVVLDIGCGSAGPAVLLAREIGCRIVAVDVSATHIEAARQRISEAGLQGRITVVHSDIYDATGQLCDIDVAIGLGAWCHFDALRLFQLCHRILKRGGRIAFMERVRLGLIDDALRCQLTDDWASPAIETFASYWEALRRARFDRVFIDDMSSQYRALQERFVAVREELRDELITVSGQASYENDLRLVRAEHRAAAESLLGYGMFVAEAL